ncbi:MAG: hypothetical protein KAH23_10485 [Kiritimatiellae bacterium]|nr:hypothetical protein [Kiritimatiellia bacterium]
MARVKIIYKSKDEVVACFKHAKEYVHYASTITIRDGGKNPVSMKLKFDDIPPFLAPMPPEEHTLSAPTLVELFLKLERWLKKYGYTFHA